MIVKYSKKFPYAPYLNEDIGFEMSIPDDGDPLAELATLKEMAEKFFKESNPHLVAPVTYSEPPYGNMPVEQVKKPLGTVGVLIKEIDSCQSVKVLESYKFMVRKDEQLQASYDKKMAELLSTEIIQSMG